MTRRLLCLQGTGLEHYISGLPLTLKVDVSSEQQHGCVALLPGTGCSSARAARGCSCAWRRARRSTCRCHWPSSRHNPRVTPAARYRLQQRACSQGLFLRLEASAVLDVPLSLALFKA